MAVLCTVCISKANAQSLLAIGGTPYLSLSELSKEKGLTYSWDPLLKNATLNGSLGSVKFHVGSEYILSRGRMYKLDAKVRYFQGSAAAPLSASRYVDGLVLPSPGASLPVSNLSQKIAFLPTHRIQRIVVDAGHGGRDFGATSLTGIREKDIVLEVAGLLREELEARGVEVLLTRHSDVFIPLQQRARIANKKGADFFVSIHANASRTRSLKGFEIYTLSEATDDAALAVERAENSALRYEAAHWEEPTNSLKAIVWDLKETENRKESILIAHHVGDSVERSVEISTRRLKAANFYVLKWTECPAVLVELGYLTNWEDERRLKNPEYRRELARALVRGLLDYKEEFEKTDGFTQ